MKIRKTILIVEDEAAIRSTLFRKLSKMGFHVVTSSSYREAESFLLGSLKIDLAIFDINLPDGQGIDLMPLVKESNPSAEVIILTGFGTIELAVTASKRGAFQFVTKPFELDYLMGIIDRALNHKNLLAENKTLRSHLKTTESEKRIIGKSQELTNLIHLAKRVADSDSTVLITGESGTGKELVARMVHEHSPRSKGPFVAVNCGALSEDLLESELFGHKKGSFTGAIDDRKGRFCLAKNGSLFLDEVGDMSPRLQVKLLRAIQERKYEPLGSHESISTNARILAATHKNLEKMVKLGQFREDLYYRLNVIPLSMPALRERKSDIPSLVNYFIEKFNLEKKRSISGISKIALECLMGHHWPGNIRELENLIERVTIIKSSGLIDVSDLPRNYSKIASTQVSDKDFSFPEGGVDFNNLVDEFENRIILEALKRTGWNKNQAAILLKLNRTTLLEKIKKKGLQKPEATSEILDLEKTL